MSVAVATAPPHPRAAYLAVGVAAAAMVATLPGRTYGLGLITEPLRADFGLGKVEYGTLNLWATLLGALFCVPAGWLVERVGVRAVLTATLVLLGAAVLGMAGLAPGGPVVAVPGIDEEAGGRVGQLPLPVGLFVLVMLSRGLGQSALSVVSLALLGKSAGRAPGWRIGVYAVLVTVGSVLAVVAVGVALAGLHLGWRPVWAGVGGTLIGAAGLAATVVRNPAPAGGSDVAAGDGRRSLLLGEALLTPAFWAFGLATSFYGLVSSGLLLFHQSVLAERGFDERVFFGVTAVGLPAGLLANLVGGWAATRVRLGLVLVAGMGLLAAALAGFRYVETVPQVYAYGVVMGVAGGILTVVFFTTWPQGYGPAHLGKIQGAAQLLTVVASAVGPLVLAAGHVRYAAYAPVMTRLAIVSAGFAIVALFVRLPNREEPAR